MFQTETRHKSQTGRTGPDHNGPHMRLGDWIRPPRHLLVLFVAVTAVSAAALGWSSWQLVRQDRDRARQRAQERRDSAVTLAVGSLQRTLESIDAQLSALASAPGPDLTRRASDYARTLPDEAVLLVIQANDVDAFPAGRLLYYPVVPRAADVPAAAFAAIDAAEFQRNEYGKAVTLLRPMAASGPPAVRAESLLRIARNLRKAGQWQQSIETYRELARLGDVPIGDTNGAPAELVARAAICDVLAEQAPGDRLVTEARALDVDLQRGKWRVLRPVYDVYSASARRWLGTTAGPDSTADDLASAPLVLSEAAREIWIDRRTNASGAGRGARWVAGSSLLVVERPALKATIVLAARPSLVESSLRLASASNPSDTRIAVADADGRIVAGDGVPDGDFSVRLGPATGLPWTVYATSAGDPSAGAFTTSWIVIAGLSAIVLVTGGSYLIGRSVMRELRVARLQSDFVSAVSHEFRTPLTSMRQIARVARRGPRGQ